MVFLQTLSEQDLAGILTEIMGKPIKYENLSPAEHAKRMRNLGVEEKYVQVRLDIDEIRRSGWAAACTGDFKELTGKEPQNLKVWLKNNL